MDFEKNTLLELHKKLTETRMLEEKLAALGEDEWANVRCMQAREKKMQLLLLQPGLPLYAVHSQTPVQCFRRKERALCQKMQMNSPVSYPAFLIPQIL